MMSNESSTFEAICTIIESISGVSVSDLSRETDLLDLGLDSLMFVRIGRVLESNYRVDISMKRFYDELSNLGALSDFLAANGSPLSASTEVRPEVPPEAPPELPSEAPVQQSFPATKLPPASAAVAFNSPSLLSLSDAAPRSAAAADINTVMSAHMALMRRYLDGVAAAGKQTAQPQTQPVVHKQAAVQTAPVLQKPPSALHHDAVETRKKFSGISTQKEPLDDQQRAFIEQLASRLSVRCRLSKHMAEEGRQYLSDWKYSLQFRQDLKELRFPVVCDTASGSRFIDVDGNEYVDIAMGMGVHYFGHSPAFIDKAVHAQTRSNLALGPQSRLAPDVARRICALTGHQRAAFFVTGSDAVMLALRLVRASRARDKIVMFAGAYHGICSDILAGQGESGAVPMSPGLPAGIVNDLVVLDYDAPESLDRIRELADELAGVLVEPVQSRNPALQPQRFLRQLRALCTELNIPLIFDEMVNGFRQAPGGMQEWFGVKADLSTYGKIIGGGYPLSVIAGNAELMQWIDGGVWHYGDDSAPLTDSISTGGTHNKHPVALAAAAAVLDHIEQNPELFHASRMQMHRLADRINVWFERHAVPLRLTYFGTQFKFESFASALELELFFYLLLEKGVYTWELHVANLSTEHTQDDADQLFAAIVYAVESLRSGGFEFRAAKLRRQYIPMSSVQQRLYAITQREGAEKPYHLAGAWRLTGKVDAARLEDCIHQVIIRHESLRTAFVVVDGEFYQRIVPEPRFFLDQLPAATGSVDDLLDAYIQPFNLLEPPLIRVALVTEDSGSQLLLIDVHHIVADGLSMNVVLQEILALYDGKRLDPVRSQARHVQDAVAQYLKGDKAKDATRYWRETLLPLANAQASFDLSPDFNRPAVTSFAGQRIALKLDENATAALHRFCSKTRISTFGALFAVFVAWTWRYARRQQFVVGLPGSGRPDAAADNAVGMFVNTLAFPAHIDEHSHVTDFLHQIRDKLFEVQEYGDYPFSTLLSDLKLVHRANRNPLFDVMFSYENAGSRVIKTTSFEGETLTQYEGAGMFDISMDLIEAENCILINCAYADSLFTQSTMNQRLADYLVLLQSLVAGQAGTVADWVNATPASAVQTTHPVSLELRQDTVYHQWTTQVGSDANAVALIEGDRQLTYAALHLTVTETAFTLFNLYGVRPGDRVIVSLDSSIDLVVVMLALFSMGAVYVPVPPETPLKRLRLITKQADCRYLIHASGHAHTAALAESGAVECIAVSALNEAAAANPPHQTLMPPEPGDVAYIIFTSGSTGVPKGVEILHAGISNSVAWRIQAYNMGSADITLQMPSAGFDASLIDILSALLSGGRLVMLDTAAKRSVENIRDAINKHRVTAMLLTPTLYRVLLNRIASAMAALRFITLAGEKLPLDLAKAHFAHIPHVELWNEYGPTECSVVVSAARLQQGEERVTIGWPIANTRIAILDENECATPVGVWGRLWVAGIGLAKGYLGDDINTHRKFRCLPVMENVRCYDTGDIARVLDTGALEFKGRDDGQVKVNGYRMELEEVEATLRSELGLTEVAAAVVDHGSSASLHAWVVHDFLPDNWREALLSVLPAWMVPVALHTLKKMPLLASGKLDRNALQAAPEVTPATVVTRDNDAVMTPTDARQEILLRYCREILARPTLTLADNYFNAGGDSIQAIVMASRLNEAGYLMDVNDLFRHPVLHELATKIEAKGNRRNKVLQASVTIQPTPMQRWFFDTCVGDPGAFTQAAWLTLPDDITLAQLDQLCRHWVSEHAVFSDTIALMLARAGGQRLSTSLSQLMQSAELDHSQTSDVADLDDIAIKARNAIDLYHGPLLNVVRVKTRTDVRALVVCHHFVVDAVSWQILQTQWALLWDDIQQKRPLRALPEGATMHQFASTLQRPDAFLRAQQEIPFWQLMVADSTSVFNSEATDESAAHTRLTAVAQLDAGVADVLLASGHHNFRSRGSDLLLAAFVETIATMFGLDAVTVLMESNGRAQRYADADFSATVGWMTSAFPLCIPVRLSADSAVSDWAAKVECIRDVTQRVPEQGIGYGVLRYLMQHPSLVSCEPEFAFNYLGRFNGHADGHFVILDESPAGDRMGELGLLPAVEFVCFADDDGLHIAVSADAARVAQSVVDNIAQVFQQQASALAASCHQMTLPVPPAPVDFVDPDWHLDDYCGLLENNGLSRFDVATIVPLTAMQSGLVFHARLKPDDLAYLEQVDFTLHDVDADLLALAFQQLLLDYPLLRAAFMVARNGRSAQVIATEATLPVCIHDLSDMAPAEQQRVIDEARIKDQTTQFNIAQPPLMRVQLFKLQNSKSRRKTRSAASDTALSGNRVHVIWTHHHLIMDGWCVGILFDRLITCYATAGQPAGADVVDNRPGDTLNRDYFRWLASRDKMTSVNYWATLLSGVERPARLMPWPNSEGHAKRQQGAGYQLQRHDVNLSAEIKNALQTLGATRNATLSSVIRLVWGVLLARFTNAADVVYGTVVSGRPPEIAGIESAVGLFINTVPVRFTLDSDLTATAALTLIQDQANAGRDHEYLPLAEIQAAAPDLSAREPLFDHLIVLENYPMDAALRGSGSSSGTSSSTTGPANTFRISDIRAFERTDLPLNLVIVPTADGLDASFLFDASVYPAQQIEHLAEHFVHLAQTLTQFPEQSLVSLNMMTPDEQHWMSAHWNVQAPGYPAHQTLVDLYQSAVSQYGDRLAIQDDLGGVSYAALHTRVQSAAAALLHHASYTPGQRVALWLPRNRDMIVAMLAVLSAGGSYVALDPIYPEERLQFIVQDSGAAVVLSSTDMPGLTFNVPVVDIHQMTEAVTAQPDLLSVLSSGQPSVAGLPPSPGSAAYVIYTSGSTGQPKGCEISHRNVVQLLRNNRFDFDFDHNDVWVAAHSFCFDFSVWEMYGALLNGGMLVVPTAAQVRNVETFVDLVAQHKVTVLNQTPAAFYQFARVALKKADNQLSALRLVIFGGDSLACNRLADWIAAFPVARVKLVNMYGITETTVHVSYREVTESDIVQPAQLNLVGRPLPQTGVWIVDRFGQLQPPGIAGEIVVSGSGVGMGYLNHPELSARKFAALDSAGQTHCYWSGDVGYIDPALGLVYLGRNDHQVQVRGYRVECEEIARCLESHQSVAEALVVPIENAHGTELVAYLTGDSTAAPAQWRPWLASRLPDYMIPACTRWLDAMPLTPNGKVDRAALPDPVSVVPTPTVDVPDTIESSIISVWKQVLGDAKIDPTTNFFDVGGHSLKALTLVDTLQSQFGYELSVADVFEFPTPRQQAAQCTVAHISHDSVVPGADPGSLDLNDLDLNDLDLDALEALLTDVSDNQGR